MDQVIVMLVGFILLEAVLVGIFLTKIEDDREEPLMEDEEDWYDWYTSLPELDKWMNKE